MNERRDKDTLSTWSAIVPNFFHDAMAYLFPPLAVFLTVLLIDSQFAPSLLSFTPYSSAISAWMNEGEGANAVMIAILLFISPIIVFPFLYVIGQLVSQLSPIMAMANPLRWAVGWSETFECWLQRALIGRRASYKRNYAGYAVWDRRAALSIDDAKDSDDPGLRKQIAYQEMAANCATLYALALLIAAITYCQPVPPSVAEEYGITDWDFAEVAIYGVFYLIAWMRFQALEFLIRERVESIAFAEEWPRRRRSLKVMIAVGCVVVLLVLAAVLKSTSAPLLSLYRYEFLDEGMKQARTATLATEISELAGTSRADNPLYRIDGLMGELAEIARTRPWDNNVCVALDKAATVGSGLGTADPGYPEGATVILERAVRISSESALPCSFVKWRVHHHLAELLEKFNSPQSRERAYAEWLSALSISSDIAGDPGLATGVNWYKASSQFNLARLDQTKGDLASAAQRRGEIQSICAAISQSARTSETWAWLCLP